MRVNRSTGARQHTPIATRSIDPLRVGPKAREQVDRGRSLLRSRSIVSSCHTPLLGLENKEFARSFLPPVVMVARLVCLHLETNAPPDHHIMMVQLIVHFSVRDASWKQTRCRLRAHTRALHKGSRREAWLVPGQSSVDSTGVLLWRARGPLQLRCAKDRNRQPTAQAPSPLCP